MFEVTWTMMNDGSLLDLEFTRARFFFPGDRLASETLSSEKQRKRGYGIPNENMSVEATRV